MSSPVDCLHPDFAVQADVERVLLPDRNLGSVLLKLTLHCTACGAPFWFPGLGTGLSHTTPVTSTDGFTAVLPVVPQGRRCEPDPSLVSTLVRTNDVHKGHRRA